tara:strand:- start:2068 stop:2886 length:819 start_codon:yes stop_codon:yes gene_type:complete
MKKLDITAIILTYNEELHIGRCIKSIKNLVKEVIVVDSYSNDKTLSICKKLNIKVYKNKFINQAKQMNWALENINIKSKWIFRLDADEFLEKNSTIQIKKIIESEKNIKGIIIKRKIKFLNKVINYGLTSPHKTLRIWKTGEGKYQNIAVDEQVEIKGKKVYAKVIIIDHNLNGFKWWTDKHRDYAVREAQSYFDIKKKNKHAVNDVSKIQKLNKYKIYYKLPIFVRAFFLFIYSYVLKLGFLSGWQGLIFNLYQILWYRILVDIHILKKKK